ncbi:MAG: SprT family zinc-dependent metalloprotease [Perlucidibaca sp.]
MTGVAYELVRSARRTLAIHIHQDGRVLVRAPQRLSRHEIEAFVRSRQDWIRQHLDEIAARPRLPAWGEGRVWWHLGKALTVVPGDPATQPPRRGRRPQVWRHQGEAALQVSPVLWQTEGAIEAALLQWQKTEAADWLPRRLQERLVVAGPEWAPAGLRLRHMRSRWGSCSRAGEITLNTQLMSVPEACIDYVICHELCHLREFNHGPRFYAWQESLCPDWRQRRQEMAGWAERLRAA